MTRFNKHCDKYQLILGYQSAYRKNFSCETAIIKITNDTLWSMELKKITSLTCIDLSAAFDTVDHGLLLNVLQNKFGISGNALSWFKSYLQPRFCRVNIHNANLKDKELLFLRAHKAAVQVQCCILHMPAHFKRWYHWICMAMPMIMG